METKKISLADFKSKKRTELSRDLSKIAGGILGACHCVTTPSGQYINGDTSYYVGYQVCVYYK